MHLYVENLIIIIIEYLIINDTLASFRHKKRNAITIIIIFIIEINTAQARPNAKKSSKQFPSIIAPYGYQQPWHIINLAQNTHTLLIVSAVL